jgi:hypothetical protein
MGVMDGPTDQPSARSRPLRILFAIALVLVFLGCLGWILLKWPLPFGLTAALIVIAAASAAVFSAYFIPNQLDERVKRALTVGATCIGLIAAIVAVPAIQAGTTGSSPGQPADTPTAAESDPLTATLDFDSPACEDFAIRESLLQSVPQGGALNAKWVYEHGGATRSGAHLTVQGKSEEAVVLQGLRVVELESNPRPADLVAILPCGPRGGIVVTRYFDVILSSPPQVVARPGEPEPGSTERGEPEVKFPFKVSSTDPEVFDLEIKGQPCLCAWRLALDWTSVGRSGTVVVDRGFDKIRTDTSLSEDVPIYNRLEDGTWEKLE